MITAQRVKRVKNNGFQKHFLTNWYFFVILKPRQRYVNYKLQKLCEINKVSGFSVASLQAFVH